jgi:hypothetical protein
MTPPLFAYSIYWDLPVLIVVVSLVYSATRFDRWDQILGEAFRWGRRMTGFLVSIGAALYVLAWWIDSGLGSWVILSIGGVAAVVMLAFYAFASKPVTSSD